MENKTKECIDLINYYKSEIRYYHKNMDAYIPQGFFDKANKKIEILENWLDKKVEEYKD